MLFACREVRIGKTILKTEGIVLPNTNRPRTANNVFIIFLRYCFESNVYVES